jgi:3-demethoxyubiquinol 3-hydroxylase
MSVSTGDWLPGDPQPREQVERILRVDHAGEYGAVRIYAGQLAVLRPGTTAELVRQMQEQERRHLETFARLVAERRVRPTALLPLWHLAGFALGAATAALGARAAMACTAAVEAAIDAHYAAQAARLDAEETGLREVIEAARRDELEHRAVALAHEAEQAPGYRLLAAAIKVGCRAAIALSERI